jgi:hypothetical protein
VRKAEGFRGRTFKVPIQQALSFTSMTTRTERFQRKPRESPDKRDEVVEEPEPVIRFSPEEEAVSASRRKP